MRGRDVFFGRIGSGGLLIPIRGRRQWIEGFQKHIQLFHQKAEKDAHSSQGCQQQQILHILTPSPFFRLYPEALLHGLFVAQHQDGGAAAQDSVRCNAQIQLSTRPDAGLFRLPSGMEEISEDQFDEEDFSF